MKLRSKSSIFCFFMMYQRLLKESFIPCVTGYTILNKKDRSKVHCIQVGLVISIYKITITVYIHILFLILPICRVRMYYFIECSFYISNLKSIYVFFHEILFIFSCLQSILRPKTNLLHYRRWHLQLLTSNRKHLHHTMQQSKLVIYELEI